MKKKLIFGILAAFFVLFGCEPNADLYDDLDALKQPYRRDIAYTVTNSDYNAIGGDVSNYQAFTEENGPMDNVPPILARNFVALNLGSSAMVTYNMLDSEPLWYDSGFGYELTADDYALMGVSNAFTPANPASSNLPFFLLRVMESPSTGQTESLIYRFRDGANTMTNIDTYRFDGSSWVLEESRTDIPFVGHEFTSEDYAHFGGSVAQFNNFTDSDPADLHVPVWLENKYPYAIEGTEKVVKYRVFSGGSFNEIAHYTLEGGKWLRSSYIMVVSEQYVFGVQGWAFDPTTRFIMSQSDYMHLAVVDPYPHPVFNDFGYYFGASAFYSNFDMRLMARRLQKNDDGEYRDPPLGAIFDSQGGAAVVEELFRRIVEEGLIKVLENRYPDATPQSGGIDVHYIVGFDTFNDNFSRSYLEAEYRCTASGNPPQFELIEGPRDRQ